ncbi:putative metal chaperone [Wickerhamomyces ciferrii]|uniref:Metal chaperone n=1 Tax=Wickerhamomyces ciferrii (strain ATCC 14091 / BCRC 22168 / CBS 111 / JCM 3599 / NBRC 0793 / NRRL Y-1031 F-60-10) TaxID=1206466 RepID=K0K829_WICCF|nr:putative metal chaperone [Wickerhamomyces ciferrii]CCH40975.1 putative metal chaperone [Wickerhamomyces ciferrii]
MVSKVKKPIPVTLLSGFLGSGKTTLLEHILTAKHGLKIAVVINDMSSLNIDAALISDHKVTKKQEKLIQLQNGCICCTLRGDLLEELVTLARSGKYQYIVIESTGISEPMQVAETFTTEFTEQLLKQNMEDEAVSQDETKILKEIIDAGGLTKLASLDTCVTVVDAVNFIENFETTEFLADRYGENGQGENERTITDLMVDQIEFSDVIIINKSSSVSKSTKTKIEKIIKNLNPVAKVITTDYSKVELNEIINTGKYDFDKASSSAGWLQSIQEMTLRDGKFGEDQKGRLAPKPETEEYGINNFVYTSRKPFHPKRLYECIRDKFLVIEQNAYIDDEEDDKENLQNESNEESDSEEENAQSDEEDEENGQSDEEDDDPDQDEDDFTQQEIIANKKASPFGPLLRSKGFFWLASRYIVRGEWSSAGAMLTLKGGIPWFAITGEQFWPEDPLARQLIKKDYHGKYDDRRQELVFIGLSIDQKALTKELDSCLLTDLEFKTFEKITDSKKNIIEIEKALQKEFEDGFEDWIKFDDDDGGDDGDVDEKQIVDTIKEKSNHGHDHTHNSTTKANIQN